MKNNFTKRGNLVDLKSEETYPAEVYIEDGIIKKIERVDEKFDVFLMPGFVDGHIHIESSMLSPLEFSKAVVRHGTVGVVTDPHEISNVLGEEGVEYMIANGNLSPLKILFGAPSCVPATSFESSGAILNAKSVQRLLERKEVGYLSEMMNFPGVIYDDEVVHAKLDIAKKMNLPIDGHAPGLSGDDLKKYVESGISTDHECFTYNEAIEKINLGMKIQIREGSGAKNYPALKDLFVDYSDMIMLCSDDLHPDDLLLGHINLLVKRALKDGYNLYKVLKAASTNAINHYNLKIGQLQVGDAADFIEVDSLENFKVLRTYIDGVLCSENEEDFIPHQIMDAPNFFNADKISMEDISVKKNGNTLNVIEAIDGELITKHLLYELPDNMEYLNANLNDDILKIVVHNRYRKTTPSVAFIKGFKLKKGALASSIAHDSHNIICVGSSDQEIVSTVNWIVENRGGIAAHDGENVRGLPLDIAGLMSSDSIEQVAEKYEDLSNIAKTLGSEMKAPFMTLAFMALLVIPEIKISDMGLFDGNSFAFIPLTK